MPLQRLLRLPRPLRFGGVGALTALLQLGLVAALVQGGLHTHLANLVAFAAATQLHFLLSSLITWHDRRAAPGARGVAGRRLISHNAMALLTLAINQAVFALALTRAHYLLASALGILTAALVNFVISERIVYAARRAAPPATTRAGGQATADG